jgi:hypothetical protein
MQIFMVQAFSIRPSFSAMPMRCILPVDRVRPGPFGPHIAITFQVGSPVWPIWSRSVSSCGAAGAALVEAVAFAVHLQDIDLVGLPVQQHAGHALGSKAISPLL